MWDPAATLWRLTVQRFLSMAFVAVLFVPSPAWAQTDGDSPSSPLDLIQEGNRPLLTVRGGPFHGQGPLYFRCCRASGDLRKS